VDNLTHSFAGWALGQAGLKSTTRKGLAALILGANMPDIDVFFSTAWWEPLAMHRGFTHSLVGGLIVMPPLLAGLLWLLDRWQVRRGARFRSGLEMHFGWLVALSYIGVATHPLLDSLTTYSVQFLSPLSGAWFHADALFIIDVWIWSVLGLAIAWSRMRERQGREWRTVPQWAIGGALAYIALNLGISHHARATLLDRLAGPRPDAIYASPPPVTFWKRALVWRQGRGIGRADYDWVRGGLVAAGPHSRDNMDLALVRQATRDPALTRFLGWSTMTTATVEQRGCTATVTFTDARYPTRRSRGTFLRQTTVKTC
jgi:inner membrane protein